MMDESNYIELDASPDKFPAHLSKLKILSKLFDAACDIGAEGHLSTFLAVTINTEEDQFVSLADAVSEDGTINVADKRLVLLNIFVPVHEDMSLELITMLPKVQMEASVIIQDILQTLKEMYLKACVIESTEGYLQ